MSITIQAVAEDAGHGRSILARLADAGFISVRLAPAGIGRLVRGTTAAYRRVANRIVAASAIILVAIGGLAGAGAGAHLAMTPATHPPTVLQAVLIVMGSALVGAAAGFLAGVLIGLVAGGFATTLRRGNRASRNQVMLALEAESLESAITAETILKATGAREIHVGGIDD